MRKVLFGVPLYTPRVTRGVQRPRSHAPSFSGRYVWQVGRRFVAVEWGKYLGLYPTSIFRVESGRAVDQIQYPDVRRLAVRKWNTSPAAPEPGDTPPPTSVVLKKHPRLLAFLTDRWYDDRSPRLPGSVWLDSDLGAFKALLKEPSLLLCARIRAATLDDLFAAVETFLGLDSPPWEPDNFAADRAGQKKKK